MVGGVDPTFREVAYREALRLGMTCKTCSQWRRDDKTEREHCALEREQFPRRICREYEYEPGTT